MIDYKSGISFPLEIEAGTPVYSDHLDSVDKSVKMIMGWPNHRRAHDNLYGSMVSYLWLPGTPENHEILSQVLRKSILENEKRVSDVVIVFRVEDSKVIINALVHVENEQDFNIKMEI